MQQLGLMEKGPTSILREQEGELPPSNSPKTENSATLIDFVM
jgi:hypothetical protein